MVTADDPAQAGGKTYVLIHGTYFGGWCWKDVAGRLRALGHRVYTPTLTGLGERGHLISLDPSLETHVEDIARMLRYEDLEDVVLVGHSFAGVVVSALADRMPERFRHLVYLDAQLLLSGESPASIAPPSTMERYRRTAYETEGVMVVPPPSPAAIGATDERMADWLKQKLTPQPFGTYTDSIELAHPLGNGLPATYVACTDPPFPNVARAHERAREIEGWTYVELPTGHNAMLLMPQEVTDLLAGVG